MSVGAIRAGEAYVRLFVRDGELRAGLERVHKEVGSWSTRMRRAFSVVSGAGLLAFGSITAAATSFVRLGDRIQKLSIKTGESAENLSKLVLAADLSNASVEALESAIRNLSTALSPIAPGGARAARALELLGLSADSLRRAGVTERLLMISDALRGIRDDTLRIDIVTALFGRGGMEILPFLDDLRVSLRDISARGLVITGPQAEAAARLNDTFTMFAATVRTLAARIFTSLAPALELALGLITKLAQTVNMLLTSPLPNLFGAGLAGYAGAQALSKIASGVSWMFRSKEQPATSFMEEFEFAFRVARALEIAEKEGVVLNLEEARRQFFEVLQNRAKNAPFLTKKLFERMIDADKAVVLGYARGGGESQVTPGQLDRDAVQAMRHAFMEVFKRYVKLIPLSFSYVFRPGIVGRMIAAMEQTENMLGPDASEDEILRDMESARNEVLSRRAARRSKYRLPLFMNPLLRFSQDFRKYVFEKMREAEEAALSRGETSVTAFQQAIAVRDATIKRFSQVLRSRLTFKFLIADMWRLITSTRLWINILKFGAFAAITAISYALMVAVGNFSKMIERAQSSYATFVSSTRAADISKRLFVLDPKTWEGLHEISRSTEDVLVKKQRLESALHTLQNQFTATGLAAAELGLSIDEVSGSIPGLDLAISRIKFSTITQSMQDVEDSLFKAKMALHDNQALLNKLINSTGPSGWIFLMHHAATTADDATGVLEKVRMAEAEVMRLTRLQSELQRSLKPAEEELKAAEARAIEEAKAEAERRRLEKIREQQKKFETEMASVTSQMWDLEIQQLENFLERLREDLEEARERGMEADVARFLALERAAQERIFSLEVNKIRQRADEEIARIRELGLERTQQEALIAAVRNKQLAEERAARTRIFNESLRRERELAREARRRITELRDAARRAAFDAAVAALRPIVEVVRFAPRRPPIPSALRITDLMPGVVFEADVPTKIPSRRRLPPAIEQIVPSAIDRASLEAGIVARAIIRDMIDDRRVREKILHWIATPEGIRQVEVDSRIRELAPQEARAFRRQIAERGFIMPEVAMASKEMIQEINRIIGEWRARRDEVAKEFAGRPADERMAALGAVDAEFRARIRALAIERGEESARRAVAGTFNPFAAAQMLGSSPLVAIRDNTRKTADFTKRLHDWLTARGVAVFAE